MSAIDITVPVFGNPTTESVRDNFATAANEIDALNTQMITVAGLAAGALQTSGGTMTGMLTLVGDPIGNLDAASKQYVDGTVAAGAFLPLTGGTLSGGLSLGGATAPGGADDLSRHIRLHTSGYGFSITSARLNYVAPTATTHAFRSGGADIFWISNWGAALTGAGTVPTTSRVGSLYSGMNIVMPQQATLSWNTYQNTSNVWTGLAGGGVAYITANAGIITMNAANSSTAGSAVVPTQILQLSTLGITMGPSTDITLNRAPTNTLHAATKAYVDTFLPLAGGTITGNLTLSQTSGTPLTVAGNATIGSNPGGVGALTIGNNTSTNFVSLYLNSAGGSGPQRAIRWLTAGVVHWHMSMDNQAETGSNTGANWNLTRYDDTGTSLGNSISINRATGLITLGTLSDTTLGLDTGGASLVLNGVTGGATGRRIVVRTASANRWLIYFPGAESGSNAGANLNIVAYADDGTTQLSTPLTITRSTGLITVAGPPTATLGVATKGYVDGAISGSAAFLPITGGTLTGHVYMNTTPAIPGDASYSAVLSVKELAMDGSSPHVAWNLYLTTVPNWKYRAAGFGSYQFLDTSGNYNISVFNSGAAGAAVGSATGQWLFRQDGAVICSGAVYFGNAASPGTTYVGSDAIQVTLAFQSGYNLIWRRSDGLLYYTSPGASGSVAFSCDTSGSLVAKNHVSATQNVYGVNFIANASMYPANGYNSAFKLYADGSNQFVQFLNGWALYVASASGTIIYQRAGATWLWGDAGAGTFRNQVSWVGGVGAYQDLSDVRGKEAISDYSRGFDIISKLRPVTFQRKPRPEEQGSPHAFPQAQPIKRRRELGFVAQDVQAVLPEAVAAFDEGAEDPELSMSTTPIIAAMVNAIKELEARIARLEA